MTDPHLPHRRGFLASLRASFLTGLVVVLPIGLTIWFVWAVIGWMSIRVSGSVGFFAMIREGRKEWVTSGRDNGTNAAEVVEPCKAS